VRNALGEGGVRGELVELDARRYLVHDIVRHEATVPPRLRV
jgi:hypothetical protein